MTQIITEERWSDIVDFPGYTVSDWGRVHNARSNLYVTPTKKKTGYLMVGLMKDSVQHKRSLPVLVACEYLPPPKNEVFDTPIHLDGDRSNCHYSNLMWRPLWFARRYMKQFNDNHVTCDKPIEDVETGEQYENSMHAAMVNGVLDNEIVLSMHNNNYVWPTGQIFRKAIVR